MMSGCETKQVALLLYPSIYWNDILLSVVRIPISPIRSRMGGTLFPVVCAAPLSKEVSSTLPGPG